MNGAETSRVFPLLPEYYERDSGRAVVEKDQERSGSAAAEVERRPARSVAKVVVGKLKGRSCEVRAHSQILRIRAEDSHIGEDIGEGNLRLKHRFGVRHFMLFTRPMLPASPLSGNTVH